MGNLKAIQRLFDEAVSKKIGSGMVAISGNLGQGSDQDQRCASGFTCHSNFLGIQPRKVDDDSIFDLASLTKVVATTSAMMVLDQQGKVDWDQDWLPGRQGNPAQLLSHTAGWPAWRPVYDALRSRWPVGMASQSMDSRQRFFSDQLKSIVPEGPVDRRTVYSDIGFWFLGEGIESRVGQGLESFVQNQVWSKIPKCDFHYRPVAERGSRFEGIDPAVVATEVCPWRGWLQGQVHDDNAWSRGGVAAHAGVFGSANGLAAWLRSLFQQTWVTIPTVKKFFQVYPFGTEARALGFDTNANAAGRGHLGFTGTSVWVNLVTGNFSILLTNRVHPSRNDLRIRALRAEFQKIC